MSPFAVVLVLSACVTHAGWNLLSKRVRATPAFFWVANAAAVVMATPVFLFTVAPDVVRIPAAVWLCLLVAGCFEAGYLVFLAAAYRCGDVSLVYPLARATPIFLVLAADMLMGSFPAGSAFAGLVLVGAGCFVLPLRRLGLGPEGLAWRSYANRASLWALATALCIAGYTITDNMGIDLLQPSAPELSGAFLYLYLELVSLGLFLLPAIWWRDGLGAIGRAWRAQRRNSIVVGALLSVTYLLILWAYAHAEVVAYVTGLRQLSIVVAVIGGSLFLKEPAGRIRLAASTIIVAGLVLIALAAG